MIDIAILRAMVAAGAPVEAILAAIEADQRTEIARVQARRLADAERQRRKRHADTDGQTVTPRDTADTDVSLTSLLPSSKSLQTNKEEGKKKVRAARASKSLLPDDWTPKAAHYAKGERGFVDRKADDLRNWAKSKAVMRADWDATFHGFLRPDGSGNKQNQQQVNGHGRRSGSLLDAIDKIEQRIEGGADRSPSEDLVRRISAG